MNGKRKTSVDRLLFEGLTVRYGRRTALDSLSGEVGLSGGVVGLFGPNGAGKSTLMRVLTGMTNRFSGLVEAPDPGDVSYMPDRPYLYGFLDVDACLRLFSSRYPDFDAGGARALARRLGIPTDRPVSTFSKGQSEQFHLALTFSRRCPLYVLDEPLGAVDPYTRDLLLDVIGEAAGDGATILMSTHIISEVERIFSRVVMINDGVMIANDTVDNFTRRSPGLEDAFKDMMRRSR